MTAFQVLLFHCNKISLTGCNVPYWHFKLAKMRNPLKNNRRPYRVNILYKSLLNIYYCFWPGGTLIKFSFFLCAMYE